MERREADVGAAEAVAVFCRQARKWIGALAAVLGGVDTLVFTGGIGENSAAIRWEICQGLEFLGIRLDTDRNAAGDEVISSGSRGATVRVIRTDEEAIIAEHVVRALLAGTRE